MTRPSRLLSGRSDRTFNKEENPHAALTSVGKRTGEALRNLPSPSSPGLMSLPLFRGTRLVVCESSTHKMHESSTDDGGIA